MALNVWNSGLQVLTPPYLSDMMLENKVLEQGAEYMEGRRELDEAVEAIAESVEIYLYE